MREKAGGLQSSRGTSVPANKRARAHLDLPGVHSKRLAVSVGDSELNQNVTVNRWKGAGFSSTRECSQLLSLPKAHCGKIIF